MGLLIRIKSSTRKLEWLEKADCSDCGRVRVGVGRRRLGYTAGGAMRLGNIITEAVRGAGPGPLPCLFVCLSLCLLFVFCFETSFSKDPATASLSGFSLPLPPGQWVLYWSAPLGLFQK